MLLPSFFGAVLPGRQHRLSRGENGETAAWWHRQPRMSSLLPLARELRSNGITRAEAERLAAIAREHGVTADERAELRAVLELYRDDFEPAARRVVEDTAGALSVSVDTRTKVDVHVPGVVDVNVDTSTRVDVVVPLFARLGRLLSAWF